MKEEDVGSESSGSIVQKFNIVPHPDQALWLFLGMLDHWTSMGRLANGYVCHLRFDAGRSGLCRVRWRVTAQSCVPTGRARTSETGIDVRIVLHA